MLRDAQTDDSARKLRPVSGSSWTVSGSLWGIRTPISPSTWPNQTGTLNDNLAPAVIPIGLGRERFEHPRFVAMRSHSGYDSFLCGPGVNGAHEKGGVETWWPAHRSLYRGRLECLRLGLILSHSAVTQKSAA
jgi:hypothetical protein